MRSWTASNVSILSSTHRDADREQARRDAGAERAIGKRGVTLGPLHGVPFSVKDLVNTKGMRTTFGSPLYADIVPTEDAPIVERMKAAGGIILGKTNTPTFGWIGATHNLLSGPRAIPGISSGRRRVERRRGGGGRGRARPAGTSAPTAAAQSAFPRPARASSASSPRSGGCQSTRPAAPGASRTPGR